MALPLVSAPSLSHCLQKVYKYPQVSSRFFVDRPQGARGVCVCVCLHTQPLASQHILYPGPVFLLSVSAAFYLWSVACMSWNAAIPLPQRIQPPSRPHAYLTLRTNRWAEAQSSVQRLWNSQMVDDAPSVCPHSVWPGGRGVQQRLCDIKTNGNVDTKKRLCICPGLHFYHSSKCCLPPS